MADNITRERVMYEGQVCTVVEHRPFGKLDLRDSYGFLIHGVPKRKTKALKEDDERRNFTIRG